PFGLFRAGDAVKAEPARLRHPRLGQGGTAMPRRMLAVHQHDAVGGPDLVGMYARRRRDIGDVARLLWIAHVDNGRAGGLVDVADIGVIAVDHDLSAAVAIEIADLAHPDALAHPPAP